MAVRIRFGSLRDESQRSSLKRWLPSSAAKLSIPPGSAKTCGSDQARWQGLECRLASTLSALRLGGSPAFGRRRFGAVAVRLGAGRWRGPACQFDIGGAGCRSGGQKARVLSLCRNRHGRNARISRIILYVFGGFIFGAGAVVPVFVEFGFDGVVIRLGLRLGRHRQNAGIFGEHLGIETFVDLLDNLFAGLADLLFRRHRIIWFSKLKILVEVDG